MGKVARASPGAHYHSVLMMLLVPVLAVLSLAFASKQQPQITPRPSVPENDDQNGQLAVLPIPVPLSRIAHLPTFPGPSLSFRPAASQSQRHVVHPIADLTVHQQTALRLAIDANREDAVKRMLANPDFDPSFGDNDAIRMACRLGGRHRIVQLLLGHPKVDPAARDSEALRVAAAKGDQWTVEALLSSGRVDPGARESEALRKIVGAESVSNRAAIVKQLLAFPAVDPSANDNEAIVTAPKTNNIELLRVLLADKRVDPGARDNEALMNTVHCRNYGAFTELLANPKVDPLARNCEALRLIIQVHRRADFLKAFFQHRRIKCHDGFKAVLARAMELTMASTATGIAGAFLTLRYTVTLVEWAVKAGSQVMADFLLADDRLNVNEFLVVAATYGNAWIVERCLTRSRIELGHYYTQAMKGAERNGHTGILQMLEEHKAKLIEAKGPAPQISPVPGHRPSPTSLPTFNPANLPPLPPLPSQLSSANCIPRPDPRWTPLPPPNGRLLASLPSAPLLLTPLPPTPVFSFPQPLASTAPPPPAATGAAAAPKQQASPIARMINAEFRAQAAAASEQKEGEPVKTAKAKITPRRKAVSRKRAGKQEIRQVPQVASPVEPEVSRLRTVELPKFSDLLSRKRKADDDNSVNADTAPRHLRGPRPISVRERMEQDAKRRRLGQAEKAETTAMEVDGQAQNGAAFDYLVLAATEAAKDKE